MRNNFGLVIVLAFLMAGCTKKIDSARFKESIVEVRQSLPEEDRSEFSEAVQGLLFADLNLFAAAAKPLETELELQGRLHGLTGQEVIEKWRTLKAERVRKREEQENAKRAAMAAAQEILAKIRIHDTWLAVKPNGFTLENTISFTVSNGTPHNVTEAAFYAEVRSPGRSIPWITGNFALQMPKDLKPGQVVRIDSLSSRAGDRWNGKPDDPKAWLYLRCEKLVGKGGAVIADVTTPKPLAFTSPSIRLAVFVPTVEEVKAQREAQHEELERRQAEIAKQIAERNRTAEAERKADEAAKDARTIEFLKKRVEGGSAASAYRLGLRYLGGEGVPVNRTEGIRLLNLAAQRGDEGAIAKLQQLGER